jgi:hypothetical protein
VDKKFNQLLSKHNIKARFKTTRIWLLNSRAIDNQCKPNELFIIELDLDISNDEDVQSKGVVYGIQWGEDKIAI